MTTTQIGVNELSIPASELSIFFSMAAAKRYAGNRLPNTADNITNEILLNGILLKCMMANGNKTKPAENIRNEAICAAFSPSWLPFIIMNELPHIRHRSMNMDQLRTLFVFIIGIFSC